MQQITYTDPDIYIEEKMKQFRLVDMREQYHELIEDAEKEGLGYKDFLIRLLQAPFFNFQRKYSNHISRILLRN